MYNWFLAYIHEFFYDKIQNCSIFICSIYPIGMNFTVCWVGESENYHKEEFSHEVEVYNIPWSVMNQVDEY